MGITLSIKWRISEYQMLIIVFARFSHSWFQPT